MDRDKNTRYIPSSFNHQDESNGLLVSRVPIVIWVALVYITTVILQTTAAFIPLKLLLFTVIIFIHIVLHWFSSSIVAFRPWIYFIAQGLLIFVSAFVMPNGFSAALTGLFPILIGQSVGVYYHYLKVGFVSLFLFGLHDMAFVLLNVTKELLLFVPLLILFTIAVVAYAMLFFKQIHARIRTQMFLSELEQAHRQVEELTLVNERQRMARDLHDTLAQGLAGLIMQLEAVDAHLSNGNTNRAQEIVLQSMVGARKTLSAARHAIDDLRAKSASGIDFADAVRGETLRFTNATGIQVSFDMGIRTPLSGLLMEHGLHIISECLTNVARHAQAEHVSLTVREDADNLHIRIKDDGKGFHTNMIGKQSGHYGLLGIYERVRLIGGKVHIQSGAQEGTSIDIEAPLFKGDSV